MVVSLGKNLVSSSRSGNDLHRPRPFSFFGDSSTTFPFPLALEGKFSIIFSLPLAFLGDTLATFWLPLIFLGKGLRGWLLPPFSLFLFLFSRAFSFFSTPSSLGMHSFSSLGNFYPDLFFFPSLPAGVLNLAVNVASSSTCNFFSISTVVVSIASYAALFLVP